MKLFYLTADTCLFSLLQTKKCPRSIPIWLLLGRLEEKTGMKTKMCERSFKSLAFSFDTWSFLVLIVDFPFL